MNSPALIESNNMNIITIIKRTPIYRKWRLRGRVDAAIRVACRELEELKLYYKHNPEACVAKSISKYHRRIHILYGRYIDLY